MCIQATEVVDIEAGGKAQEFLFSKSLSQICFLSLWLSTIEKDAIMNKLLRFNLQGSCQKLCDLPDTPVSLIKPMLVFCDLLGSSWESNHKTRLMHIICFSFSFMQKDRITQPNLSSQQVTSKNMVRRPYMGSGSECISLERGRNIRKRGLHQGIVLYCCGQPRYYKDTVG